jgi:hypothetical protein
MRGRVVDRDRPAVDEHYNRGDADFHDGLNQLILNLNFNQNGINTNTYGSTTSGSCTDGRAHYTTGRRVLELALKYNF